MYDYMNMHSRPSPLLLPLSSFFPYNMYISMNTLYIYIYIYIYIYLYLRLQHHILVHFIQKFNLTNCFMAYKSSVIYIYMYTYICICILDISMFILYIGVCIRNLRLYITPFFSHPLLSPLLLLPLLYVYKYVYTVYKYMYTLYMYMYSGYKYVYTVYVYATSDFIYTHTRICLLLLLSSSFPSPTTLLLLFLSSSFSPYNLNIYLCILYISMYILNI